MASHERTIDIENVETGRPDRILVQHAALPDRRGHAGYKDHDLLTVIDGEVVFPSGDEFVAEFSRRRFRRKTAAATTPGSAPARG